MFGQERADDRAWLHDRRWQISWQIQASHQLGGPGTGPRIHHLSSRSIGEFADRISGQPVIEKIWNRKQSFCRCKKLGSLTPSGEELIQGVDWHELNAGRVVDLFLANLP